MMVVKSPEQFRCKNSGVLVKKQFFTVILSNIEEKNYVHKYYHEDHENIPQAWAPHILDDIIEEQRVSVTWQSHIAHYE